MLYYISEKRDGVSIVLLYLSVYVLFWKRLILINNVTGPIKIIFLEQFILQPMSYIALAMANRVSFSVACVVSSTHRATAYIRTIICLRFPPIRT